MATGAYRYLVRTADGRTPENPCGTFCWELDVANWVEVAEKINALVARAWGKLAKVNPTAAESFDVAFWQQQVSELPGFWDIYVSGFGLPGRNREVVDSIIGLCNTGADLLEDIQTALGNQKLPVGGAHSSGSLWDSLAALAIGAGVVTGLGALVWHGYKQKRSRTSTEIS